MPENPRIIMVSSISVNNDPYNYFDTESKRNHRLTPQMMKTRKTNGESFNLGPNLTMLLQMHEEITDFYLLTNKAPNALTSTEELSSEVQSLYGNDLQFHKTELDFQNPTKYQEVYPAFEKFVLDIQKTYPYWEGHRYRVLINPGTPTMHSVWFFLVKSDMFPATMYESIPPRFLNEGDAPIVEFDVEAPTMPAISKIKREERNRIEKQIGEQKGLERIAELFAANLYLEDQNYGFYQITHQQDEMRVLQTLKSIEQDLQANKNLMTTDNYRYLEDYIEQVRAKAEEYSQNRNAYNNWEGTEASNLKEKFRLKVGKFEYFQENKLNDKFPRLDFEVNIAANCQHDEFYIDVAVLQKALHAIIKGIDQHAYNDTPSQDRRAIIHYERSGNEMLITVEDHGQGYYPIDKMFGKRTGNDLADIKRLARYFNIEATSSCWKKSSYNLNTGAKNSECQIGLGYGVKYTIKGKLPNTRITTGSDERL